MLLCFDVVEIIIMVCAHFVAKVNEVLIHTMVLKQKLTKPALKNKTCTCCMGETWGNRCGNGIERANKDIASDNYSESLNIIHIDMVLFSLCTYHSYKCMLIPDRFIQICIKYKRLLTVYEWFCSWFHSIAINK